MKLKDYLSKEALSEQAFAELIGVKQSAVNRYCRGRVPKKPILERIVEKTGGAVAPNDFYQGAAE